MSSEAPDPDWSDASGEFDEASFSGVARLFPLAGVSMLPGIVQPLHVFEERYRALMEDALAGDHLIAMAVLKPGWESEYSGRPPLEETACLGKIVTHQRLEDGRYNLLLAGLRRVRIEREIEPVKEFRLAEVRLVKEKTPDSADREANRLCERLLNYFKERLSESAESSTILGALNDRLPLRLLTDLVAYTLPLEDAVKREMLAEADVRVRAARLLECLEADPPGPDAFPPPFSAN